MASYVLGHRRLVPTSRFAPERAKKGEERVHAIGLHTLYAGFTEEEKEHHSQSLAKLRRAKLQIQAGHWPNAERFIHSLDEAIKLGVEVTESGKDTATIKRGVGRFFAAKAQVLADIYSAVPGSMIRGNVHAAGHLARRSRVNGDRERTKLIIEGVTLPAMAEQHWNELKEEEDRLQETERAHRSHRWVHDLIKLSYEIETAEALMPKDLSEQRKISHSVEQLNQAKDQALGHGNDALVDECASLISRVEDEPRTHEDWTKLNRARIETLVKVWSIHHLESSTQEAVNATLRQVYDDLTAIAGVRLVEGTELNEFSARANELQAQYIARVDHRSQQHPNQLIDTLALRYETDQLLFDMREAESDQHQNVHEAQLELARDSHRGSPFVCVSQRTATRYNI